MSAATPIVGPESWFCVHVDREGAEWVVRADARNLPKGPRLGAAVVLLAEAIEAMQLRVERLNDQAERNPLGAHLYAAECLVKVGDA